MKLIFLKPPPTKVTATIHKTGRLGFSVEAEKLMDLQPKQFIKISKSENHEKDGGFYLVKFSESDEQTFRVCRAGLYYYINTQHTFKSIELDLSKGHIFDVSIHKEMHEDKPVYILMPRKPRKV